jgi:hypothetical protein
VESDLFLGDASQDLLDYCVINLSETRSRQQIMKQMKRMELSYAEFVHKKKKEKTKKSDELNEKTKMFVSLPIK